MKIKTAVIAAAGSGTRMAPFSTVLPKEMIPIITTPIMQYVVAELASSGVERLVVVIDENKDSIKNYFNKEQINKVIAKTDKKKLRETLQSLLVVLEKFQEIIFVNQHGKYGNGTPILAASPYINNEPFFYTWADDFIMATPTRFLQLAAAYNLHPGHTVLSGIYADSAGDNDHTKYAYTEHEKVDDGLFSLRRIHEKPGHSAPSSLGVLSGHLFSPNYLEFAKKTYDNHKEGEFLFNDVLHEMVDAGEKVYICEIKNSRYFDTGNPVSYVKTFIEFAMKDEEMGPEIKEYLKKVV